MTNDEIISRVTKLESLYKADTQASEGLMGPEEAKNFIQEVMDESQFLSIADFQKMQNQKKTISLIGLQSRLLRKGVKGVDPDASEYDMGERELDTVETILAVNVDFDTLEENIEEEGFEQTINRIFTTQFSNDLTDLAWNGKEDSGDDFLEINDGYLEIADTDSGIHAVPFAGNDTPRQIFKAMLAEMPNKYKVNPANLTFFLSPSMKEDYLDEIGDRATSAGDKALIEGWAPPYKGINLFAVPNLTEDRVLLTHPKNLKIGWHKRYVRVGKWINERKRRIEYTITTKCDAEYAISDQIVLATKP